MGTVPESQKVKSYEDLVVWQKSMDLVELIYKLTDSFPQSETYGLSGQMRRAAISIPSNLAEGSRRGSRKDFRQFVFIAFGSASELETQLKIAKRLGYVSDEDFERSRALLGEVLSMLNALARKLS